MWKIISLFKMKKADLFSITVGLLAIFLFIHVGIRFDVFFMVYLAIFTLAMDWLYRLCK